MAFFSTRLCFRKTDLYSKEPLKMGFHVRKGGRSMECVTLYRVQIECIGWWLMVIQFVSASFLCDTQKVIINCWIEKRFVIRHRIDFVSFFYHFHQKVIYFFFCLKNIQFNGLKRSVSNWKEKKNLTQYPLSHWKVGSFSNSVTCTMLYFTRCWWQLATISREWFEKKTQCIWEKNTLRDKL